jgi:uncharacterized repeat protein (TIGR01451 family)
MKQRPSKTSRYVAGLLLIAAAWAPAAWANPVVASRLEVKQVVNASGHEVLKSAAAVKPGDTLQYRAIYTNSGDQPAGHLMARLPVPEGTTLLAQGMLPALAEASVDGSTFAAMPLMQTVIGKDGKSHREPVPLSAIRAVRWDLGTLEPSQARPVQIREHVNTPIVNPAASSAPAKASRGASAS